MRELEISPNLQTFGGEGDDRSWLLAMLRGMGKRCPECGAHTLFSGYVRTRDACPKCGLDFSGHRADDAPPYMTIFIVGHVLIPGALLAKQLFDPPLGLQFAVVTPLILISTFWLLPIIKGGLIGVQWANRMHGFAGPDWDPESDV